MEILDHNGAPARKKFIHGADTSRRSGAQFATQNKSLDELITERDRDVIVSLSKRLTGNLGPAKCVINQIASYSVGNAYFPSHTGTEDDEKDVETVTKWLVNSFYKRCDIRGGIFDMRKNLKLVSKSIDLTGDHFTLLTTNEDGTEPRIKTIPDYNVRTKGDDLHYEDGKRVVKGGIYDGGKIIYGIIYNEHDRALAYRVSTGRGNNDFIDIDAAYMHHSFDLEQSDDRRGLPVATHALEELKHILQSNSYERNRQLILSSIGLMVKNSLGAPDMNDVSNILEGGNSGESKVTAQRIDQAIWYAQAGSGDEITQLRHESGGDTFESFQDRMIRSFTTGAGWSYSLVWKPTGQGTAERGEILQARRSVEERQKILDSWILRVVSYAYAFKAKRGDLPILKNPFAWKFSKPPRITVDDGREGKDLRESYRLGSKNMSDINEYDGTTYEEHLDKRINEVVKRKLKIKAAEEKHGVKIDDREIIMLTPNETKDEDNEQSNKSSSQQN